MSLARLLHENHEACSSELITSGSPYAIELLQRFKVGVQLGCDLGGAIWSDRGDLFPYQFKIKRAPESSKSQGSQSLKVISVGCNLFGGW